MTLAATHTAPLSQRIGYALEAARLWLGGKPPAIQVAALPWRRVAGGRLEVLLATSRDTGRWVLPKGWPKKRRSLSRTAAEEAWEEAGLIGKINSDVFGTFDYRKRLDSGLHRRVRVSVFLLAVERQATRFPECGERTLRWFAPEEAARRVREPELAALLRNMDSIPAMA